MPFIVGEKVSEVLTRLPEEQRSSAHPAANFLSNLARKNNNPGTGHGGFVFNSDHLAPTFSLALAAAATAASCCVFFYFFFLFEMFLLCDWLYFYAPDWSRGEERREAKCSSGGFRLFARCCCSLGEVVQQVGAAGAEQLHTRANTRKTHRNFLRCSVSLVALRARANGAGGEWGVTAGAHRYLGRA